MKDYIKMMLEAEQLKFLVFAHHLTMLQACTEAVIEAKVTPGGLQATGFLKPVKGVVSTGCSSTCWGKKTATMA